MARTAGRRRTDQPWNPPVGRPDISTIFVLFAAGPLLLPVLGPAKPALIAFGLALVLTASAALRCWGASRRVPSRRGAWLLLSATGLVAAAASLAAIAFEIANVLPHVSFYLGATASATLLLGVTRMAHETLPRLPLLRAVDALLLALVVVGAAVYFVVIPSLREGDAVLTGVFTVDLVAVLVTSLAVVAAAGARRSLALALLVACGAAAAGDALVAATDAGLVGAPLWTTGVLWAVAGWALAAAPTFDDGRAPVAATLDPAGSGWFYARVLLPLAAVIALPLTAVGVWLAAGLEPWAVAYFAVASIVVLALAFWRQAHLLVENRRAMTRERRLREEVVRRNRDLEALTGLATTLTQTLEEVPIYERGLEVLQLASRATSAALHVSSDGRPHELVASAGDWQRERIWALEAGRPRGGDEGGPRVERRGAREIVYLPLCARGRDIGGATLLRPAGESFRDEEVGLLRILSDQLGIAIQNARDYRDKLEQAVRDPLTGIYNRRYFFEALDHEIHRAERYGTHASLVIFDLDGFKRINDTLGHVAGDEVLRRVAGIVTGLIRDVDTFARIGGEEFALLLPETQQLEALLVAERVRTSVARQRILSDRRVTLSAGVSSCPIDASTREELEQAADAALYWAKRNGKNICALASEAATRAPDREASGVVPHLYALVSAIDAGHLQARDHSENVAAYAVAIAQELGLDGDRVTRLRRAAVFHDVGKVAVDAAVLAKPGKLDQHEYEQVKLHPGAGATMLRHAGLAEEAVWVRAHHERVDGRGYPDGLRGDEIPLEARILFVADAFEAMTSDRPYRRGAEVAVALEELRACAGTQFDPDAVAALERLVGRGELPLLALRAGELPA